MKIACDSRGMRDMVDNCNNNGYIVNMDDR